MNRMVPAEIATSDAGLRVELPLDGTWEIQFGDEPGWQPVTVPGPWQEMTDRAWQTGSAVYRLAFSIPQGWAGREIGLSFGAVGYFCEVRVNGERIGSHEGSYLPFRLVVPPHLIGDLNILEVRAVVPSADASLYPDYPFGEIPHGKQSWYGPLGGIWQSVRLDARDSRHIAHCAVSADPRTGAVDFAIELAIPDGPAEVRITVRDDANIVVQRANGVATGPIQIAVPEPHWWSPDAPHLYRAEVELVAGGVAIDRISESFGFRSIETRDGQILLNGEPIFLRGALDQDYYPDGICTPPSLAFLEDQARKAKALGLNLLRMHIKVPDPRYYEVADRLGLLVWTETPNVQTLTLRAAERLRETMVGILRRDGNHPSIIAWTIINEDWGTRLVENVDHRVWLKATYDWLKRLDPNRLVIDNSACFPNFHLKTDLNDYHYYKSVPERRSEWNTLTADFANGARWTFSPHGDAERRGDEPLVVSEFGVWGLPHPRDVLLPEGTEPFWFQSGSDWADGCALPAGIEQRFNELQLGQVFGSFAAFIEAVQWYQFGNLKYEIEEMRSHASIMGYVITELTDVHWEANGLMDLERNPRVFADRFAEVNADLVIVPRIDRYSGYAGSTIEFGLQIATGSASVPAGAELRCSVDGRPDDVIVVPQAGPVTLVDLGWTIVTLPAVASNRMVRLSFELTVDETILARNSVEIAVYAPRSTEALPVVATRNAELADYLRGLAYKVVLHGPADVYLERGLDLASIDCLNKGGRVVVLADAPVGSDGNLRWDVPSGEEAAHSSMLDQEAMPRLAHRALPNIDLHSRADSIWRGDWVAGFSWVRRSGAFADLPGGPLFDLSFDRVVPHHVMTGFKQWEMAGHVHAGVVVGWVHKPAAFILERPIGLGTLVSTTFRLTCDAPGVDPVATALLDAIIRTAAESRNRDI